MNFVIQGKEFRVDTGDPVDADIAKALEEAGISGGPDGWTARSPVRPSTAQKPWRSRA